MLITSKKGSELQGFSDLGHVPGKPVHNPFMLATIFSITMTLVGLQSAYWCFAACFFPTMNWPSGWLASARLTQPACMYLLCKEENISSSPRSRSFLFSFPTKHVNGSPFTLHFISTKKWELPSSKQQRLWIWTIWLVCHSNMGWHMGHRQKRKLSFTDLFSYQVSLEWSISVLCNEFAHL